MKPLAAGIFLVMFSTLCFYIPSFIFNLNGFDISSVPKRFYQYYCWMMTGAFCLNIMYAAFLFYLIKPEHLVLKMAACWLVIGETYTLVYHILNKIYLLNASSTTGKIATLVVFTFSCLFFFYRAIRKPTSEKFDPRKTFIIRYLPKNTIGVFNYIWDHAGHKALYQDGKIYKFEKDSGLVEYSMATYEYFKHGDISLKEIPMIRNIDKIIGKRYSLMKFNCNHLVKYAIRTQT
jgi:hypothetical protein